MLSPLLLLVRACAAVMITSISLPAGNGRLVISTRRPRCTVTRFRIGWEILAFCMTRILLDLMLSDNRGDESFYAHGSGDHVRVGTDDDRRRRGGKTQDERRRIDQRNRHSAGGAVGSRGEITGKGSKHQPDDSLTVNPRPASFDAWD